jgi:hypothetical protein
MYPSGRFLWYCMFFAEMTSGLHMNILLRWLLVLLDWLTFVQYAYTVSWNDFRWPLVSSWIFYLRWPLVSSWIFYIRWPLVPYISWLLFNPHIIKWVQMASGLLMVWHLPPILADFCFIPLSWNYFRWSLISSLIFYQRWPLVPLYWWLLLNPCMMKCLKITYSILIDILYKVAPSPPILAHFCWI